MKLNYSKVLKKIAAQDCYNRRHDKKKFMKYAILWFKRFEQNGKKLK